MEKHRMRPLGRTIAATLLVGLATCTAGLAQQLAVTFDDLPSHGPLPPGETRIEVARKIVGALKAEHLPPVYGFVNGVWTEREPATGEVLQLWHDAGNPLGDHTWTHLNLATSTPEAFEAEMAKSAPLLQRYMGTADWHWLRYPFLSEGEMPQKRDAVRAYLAAHGYRIAGVTMGFGDYAYNDPYARCMAKGDTAAVAHLKTEYLDGARASATYSRTLAKAALGHDIPYVLLMHLGAFDAEMLPQLLRLYRSLGFQFVTLPQAESDPSYRNDLDPSLPSVPDSLEAAAALRHVSLKAPAMPADLETLCQ